MQLKTEITRFLDTLDRSPKTIFTYRNALNQFIKEVGENAELNTDTYTRHDIRASKKIRPIAAGGMWKAIKSRIEEAGVERNAVRIHDFRHYFVTMTYMAREDLKLSQLLARHESINTTNRYAHFGSDLDTA